MIYKNCLKNFPFFVNGMYCAYNILLILIMRIQILLSSFLNTAKNANVNSFIYFPSTSMQIMLFNVIMASNSIVKHQRIPGEI